MEAKYVNLNCTISVARNVKVVKRNFCERKAEKATEQKTCLVILLPPTKKSGRRESSSVNRITLHCPFAVL